MSQATAGQIERIASRRAELLFVEEGASVAEAAVKMGENHVGSLMVRGDGGALTGMLTERDILRRIVAQGRDPFSVTVSAIMSPNVIHCTQSTTIRDLQGIMAKYQIRHVPLVEGDTVVGIVTSRDLHAHELAEVRLAAQVSRQVMYK